jgi:hypothetical protein
MREASIFGFGNAEVQVLVLSSGEITQIASE